MGDHPERFSAMVTLVNLTEQTEAPWDAEFTIHRVGTTFQDFFVAYEE